MNKKRRIYPKHKHLLGKEIVYKGNKCFVVGIDSRKGITIDYLDLDKGGNSFGHLLCLHDPKIDYDNFHKHFCRIVDFLEEKIDSLSSVRTERFRDTDVCAWSKK